MAGLRVLTHHDVEPEDNPTGEELLDRSRPPLKVWVPMGSTLVLGHSQDPERELHVATATADEVTVFKRMGGGGAVLLTPGCLCLGLRFAKQPSLGIHDYFRLGSGVKISSE